jgi:hypothetical protein
MSFDLYFCSSGKRESIISEFSSHFMERKFYSKTESKEGNIQYFYENEETGVYFSFDYNGNDPDDSMQEEMDGFLDTGLSFNINFVRPSFFGMEAMPEVVELQNQLDLLIYDCQAHSRKINNPGKYTAEELYDSWCINNLRATSAMREKDYSPLFMNHEKAAQLWEYQYKRSQLQDEVGNDTFIPRINVLKRKNENQILTVVAWPDGISEVIPPCDFLFIHQEKKGIFKKSSDMLISYSAVINSLGKYLTPFSGSIPGSCILLPRNQEKAHNIFNSLQGEILSKDTLEPVGKDRFIDFTI